MLKTENIRPGAQSLKITRGETISKIKYSFFRDSHTKLNASRDSEEQKEKITENI
jgi:hypothetical protein